MLRPTRERIVWLALTVVLGLEIRFDFLHVLNPLYKQQFQNDSDTLVHLALVSRRPAFGGLVLPGGQPYLSQFGLQGMVMNWLSPGDQFYGLFRVVTAMLTAAVLSAAVVAAWRAWGRIAAVVLLLFFTTSFWINAFGLSTYWQLWTMLLPTLLPILVWPKLGEGRRKWLRGGALVAALIFLKCLCGYEYISTLLFAVGAGVAFHEFRGRIDLRFLRSVVGAMAAGLVGFLLALAVHVIQLVALFGSPGYIWGRVTARTFEPPDYGSLLTALRGWHDPLWGWLIQNSDSPFRLWLFQAVHYLSTPAIQIPNRAVLGLGPVQYGVPMWVFVIVWAVLAVRAFRGRGTDAAVQRRLAVSAGLGLIGAWSWLTLAFGHMIFHLHIDPVVFYLPFLPLVYAMIGLRVQTAFGRDARAGAGSAQRPAAGEVVLPEPVGVPPLPAQREVDLADV